jgi:hypothetical protein
VTSEASRYPLLRAMLGNATLLSVIYLAAAIAIEAVRRFYPSRPAEQASLAIESLPARALDLLGVLRTLRRTYAYGEVSEVALRLLFGGTTVAIIFAMALMVGAGMWLVRALVTRRR